MTAAIELQPRTPGAGRYWLVLVVLLVSAVGVISRAFYLQVLDHQFLSEQGNMRFIRTLTLPGFRGAILDRRGEPLALSAPVDSIWAVPSDVLAAPQYLPALAKLLHMPGPRLTHYLKARSNRQFVYLERQIDPDKARRILALKAPGVFSQREYRRYYPAGAVTAQVVGFTDIDGKGQAGIELADNQTLHGIDGERRVIRDRTGRVVQEADVYRPARPGKDVHLTLDLRLQYIAYRDLRRAVLGHHASGGSVVIADAETGQILALANQPSFNPNNPADRDSQGLRDQAVTDIFEPGSSIKPLLISQAIARGKFNTRSLIDTGDGTFTIDTITIHDDTPNGVVDLKKLLEKSSNIGAAKVGLALGAKIVWSGYEKFGLGERTGIGLPGEGEPILRPWTAWGDVATATASYGYGVAVNALQMVRAYCALADNGLMPQLSITESRPPEPPQRVIPAKVARTVRHLLEGVVSPKGTADDAAVPGYQVAGKTGTARMTTKGAYVPGRYRAVFVGMLPADHPRLVGIVVINDPKGSNYYGGSVAGPVFSNVMQAAARLLQIAPDRPAPDLLQATDGSPGARS